MSYEVVNGGSVDGFGALSMHCSLSGLTDPVLASSGSAAWKAIKPCVHPNMGYNSATEINMIWVCNKTNWKAVIRSLLVSIAGKCPSGRVPYGIQPGTFSIDDGLAINMWMRANADGYHITKTALITIVHRVFVSMHG